MNNRFEKGTRLVNPFKKVNEKVEASYLIVDLDSRETNICKVHTANGWSGTFSSKFLHCLKEAN